jgi:hypothetical protein
MFTPIQVCMETGITIQTTTHGPDWAYHLSIDSYEPGLLSEFIAYSVESEAVHTDYLSN